MREGRSDKRRHILVDSRHDSFGSIKSPSLSPDQERIAFVAEKDGSQKAIYVVTVRGEHCRQVSKTAWFTDAPEAECFDPAWDSDAVIRYKVTLSGSTDFDEEGNVRIWDEITFEARVTVNDVNAPVDHDVPEVARKWTAFER